MIFFTAWGIWQKISAGVVGVIATISAMYGAFIAVSDIVWTEAEAGEYIAQQHRMDMNESYNREKGDLETQLQINNLWLNMLESEAEYRQLNTREVNTMKRLQAEEAVIVSRIERLSCLQDPARDPATCD